MKGKVRLSALSYLTCGMIEYLVEKEKDVEAELKSIGYEAGIKLLEIFRFERELHIPTLLYRLTFDFLSGISDSEKKIEKVEGEDDVYLLTDLDSMFSRFISVPPEWEGFSADSLLCGVIQAVLMASGYNSEVVAFQKPTESLPDRVVFQIRILRVSPLN